MGKLFQFVKPGGSFYYQSLDETEPKATVQELCEKHGMRVEAYLLDTRYGFRAQYWKIVRPLGSTKRVLSSTMAQR